MTEVLTSAWIVYGTQDYEFDRNSYEYPFISSFQYFTQQVNLGNPLTSYFRYTKSEVVSIENYYFFWPTETYSYAVEYHDVLMDMGKLDK